MKTLSNFDLLELWERGSCLHPIDRALLALALALPGETYDALSLLPLGRRNAALAELRLACFGSALTGWVACPLCSERLEFSFDAELLLQDRPEPPAQIIMHGQQFRPLNSLDLASVAAEIDDRAAALHLLKLCSLESGEFHEEFSEADLDDLGNLLAQADPLAETLLDFDCAACGHRWQEPLDMAAWLWAEVEARARHLLYDVHTLAAAYGWREHEILSLSERRRALYLEMVQA